MSLLLWSRQRFINTGHKQQFRERKKEEKNYKFALEIVKQKKKNCLKKEDTTSLQRWYGNRQQKDIKNKWAEVEKENEREKFKNHIINNKLI